MAVFDDILESKTATLRSELAAAKAEVERLTKELERAAMNDSEWLKLAEARAQSAKAALAKLREAIAPFADFADFLASNEVEGTSPTDELIITFEESGIVLQRFTIAQFDALRALVEKEGE